MGVHALKCVDVGDHQLADPVHQAVEFRVAQLGQLSLQDVAHLEAPGAQLAGRVGICGDQDALVDAEVDGFAHAAALTSMPSALR